MRQQLPFAISKNISVFRMRDLQKYPESYIIDWDVYLPSIGMNLQRGYTWTLHQKQQLILSILKGVRIPAMAIVCNQNVYQIIDGKQRLSSWLHFVQNSFSITHGGKEYYFEDCDEECKRVLTLTHVEADLVYEDTSNGCSNLSDRDKIAWFNLINFAGTPQDSKHYHKLEQAILKFKRKE